MKVNYFLRVIPLLFVVQLYGAASSSSGHVTTPTIIAVGGQNTLGSEVDYVAWLFGASSRSIVRAQIPQGWLPNSMDLGQHVCMEHLARSFPASGDVVFHATSQGTATVLNFVAGLDKQDQARVKAIVLEAALASGNDAIIHTSKMLLGRCLQKSCSMQYPEVHARDIMDAPGCYYAFPYVARPLFPRYAPSGIQPIKSIEDITHDIPIVIIHSKYDPCLPYSGASALYYGLRSQGHENVYIISVDGERHIRILEWGSIMHKALLDKIMAKHSVFAPLKGLLSDADLAVLQPDVERHREDYEHLYARELNHEDLPPVCAASACAICLIAKPEAVGCCASSTLDICGALLSWFK
jgi:hypothetical protein